MRVVFCLPGRTFSDKFLKSWTNLLVSLTNRGIHFGVSQGHDPVVYYARNKCLGGDLMRGSKQKPWDEKVEYDYMMWIDSDMVFKYEHFSKLLDHDKDIVSGMYMMRDMKHFTTVKKWDEDFFSKHGYFPFLKREDVIGEKKLMTVDYTGFGWMLVKCGVFESMEYPWFRPEWKEFKFKGTNAELSTKPIEDTVVSEFTSEDVSWCHEVQKNGFDIHVDPTIIVGHEKNIVL